MITISKEILTNKYITKTTNRVVENNEIQNNNQYVETDIKFSANKKVDATKSSDNKLESIFSAVKAISN